MSINLRPYQNDLVASVRESMKVNKTVLLQLATGGGKTALASFMVRGAYEKGKRVMFSVHRKELIRQTAVTFDEFDIRYSYVASGLEYNPYSKIHICSIDTFKNRLGKVPDPDVLFIDECHMAASEGWSRVINYYRQRGAWIIGLSATPWRLSGEGLGMHFQDMICGPSMRWLIENKFLSDYRLFAPSTPDMQGVKIVAGDYHKGQLGIRMEEDAVITGDAIEHYKKHARGKLCIMYCVSRKHSERVAQQFRDAGISAHHIDGETPNHERRRIISAFANRQIEVLTNVELVTTGFDLAAQVGRDITVEAIAMLRPTQSLSLYLQMVGRGLRYKGGAPAIILDHAGNAMRHGLPCDDRKWSLADRDTKARAGAQRVLSTRQCDKCFFVHPPAPACPDCGNIYPVQYREVDEVDGDLQEIDPARMRQMKAYEQHQAQSLDDLIKLGYARGMAPGKAEGWASRVYTARKAKEKGSKK